MTTTADTAEFLAAVAAKFVKPITCSRCKGDGILLSQRVVHAGAPGGCFKCNGWGLVEGDRAAIAAAKARTSAVTGIIRDTMEELVAAGISRPRAMAVSYGLDHLATNAPERYEAALASYLAGHPGLTRAVWAYTAEQGFVWYGATTMTVEAAMALLGGE